MLLFQINHKVIGHRGASAFAPENTLSAFNKALTLHCNFIEFDVMLSCDNEPFVIHDETLSRTTNGKGEVGLMSASYLASLDAGVWFSEEFAGERVPHFGAVLEWLNHTNINANIEIKPYPGTAQQTAITVISYIQSHWPKTKQLPLISSFDSLALNVCRSISPEMPIGYLIHGWEKDCLKKAHALQCYSIHCNKAILTERRVKQIKEEGYALFAYTVNHVSQAKRLFSWGVDAVFSDFPDLMS